MADAADKIHQAVAAMVKAHTAEVKALRQRLLQEATTMQRRVRTLTREVQGLRRQRDTALGKVAEYRSYATKYQRELVAARKEIKQLLKDQSNA